MSDLFDLLPQTADNGPWVLVTLVQAEGSTYRKLGAHLLVNAHGHLGMLSGGCLEADVAARCAPILNGQTTALEMVIDTRRLLGCDGRLTLVAERLPEGLAAQVREVARGRSEGVLCTFKPGPGWQPTGVCAEPMKRAYCQDLKPPIKLLVFGSTPGVAPLLQMGEVLSWQTEHLVLASDPAVRRQPNHGWRVLRDIKSLTPWIDNRTACVVMNHHVGRDMDVLSALWETSTPFLGLLGSQKRRDLIMEQLAFSSNAVDLERRELYAPVGISLGAEGAPEIALEICAQIQSVLAHQARVARRPETGPGRLRSVKAML